MSKVGWIGLGVMGFPMAGYVRERGKHEMTVYNRTAEKAERWIAKYGGRTAKTPAEAADGAEFVFSCVGNDDDLREVTTGPDGAFETLKPGAVYIDNTTASATVARELAGAAGARDAGFLDAPVSGGQAGAEKGTLTVMVGGEESDFSRAEPLIACFAKSVRLIGPAGSGQLTKMVNQICITGMIQALAEALNFARRAELDVPAVIETISKGAAQSWHMDNRWRTMNDGEFNHGFAVDWIRKDLSICIDEARRNGAELPVTALVDQFFAGVQKLGGGRWDATSLIALLQSSPRKKGLA